MKLSYRLLQFSFVIGLLLVLKCSKNSSDENLIEPKNSFSDSIWVFNATGDTIKDKIIGLWLSHEVSYDNQICGDCDSLFTWVIESNRHMVRRNNPDGDHETTYGVWTLSDNKKYILFSWDIPPVCGPCKDAPFTETDSIEIINSMENELWTSEDFYYPPTTKINIKFHKLNM
jgi:hypothetical protein